MDVYKPMDIEVLYIPDCPGYRPTVDAIRQIVAEDHVKATVKAVEVTNPNTPGFNGSPTVRINGKDIESGSIATTCGGLACRTYVQMESARTSHHLRLFALRSSGNTAWRVFRLR
jgi:hypothetical protein